MNICKQCEAQILEITVCEDPYCSTEMRADIGDSIESKCQFWCHKLLNQKIVEAFAAKEGRQK